LRGPQAKTRGHHPPTSTPAGKGDR
jgi:hypothetical protein